MVRRRSPYSSPEEDQVPDLSIYSERPEEEEQSPLMRNAMAQNEAAGNRGYGGGAGDVYDALTAADLKSNYGPEQGPSPEAVSRYTAPPDEPDVVADPAQATEGGGSMSWVNEAPEAAGAASFSTTPRNAPPRSEEPIRNTDVPKVGDGPSEKSQNKGNPTRNPFQDAVDRTDAKIEKLREKMGGAGAFLGTLLNPHTQQLYRDQMNALLAQRKNFAADAAMYEDKRGANALARAKLKSEASIEVQKLKNQQNERRESAIKNTGKVFEDRIFRYIDPDTHRWVTPQEEQQQAGPPTAEGVYPESIYSTPKLPAESTGGAGAAHYSQTTDAEGNVHNFKNGIEIGTTKGAGKPERPLVDEEQRIERDARTSARSAAADFRKNGPALGDMNPPKTEREAFQYAYISAGGNNFAILHPKGEQRKVNTPTGEVEVWTSDGKKFVPPPKKKLGARASMARSH